MLGRDLVATLSREGEEVVGFDRVDVDITRPDLIRAAVDEVVPKVIVNCAAWTRVDDAEQNEDEATLVNGTALEYLADGANRHGALLVQVSTDFVFDGTSREPYEVDAPYSPLSAYGRSKLAGEFGARTANRHAIIRTSWLFGRNGWNFVEAMRKQIDSGREELRVVSDQRGRPTYTPHLAEAVIRIARLQQAHGVYHYADDPECTWYDFACEIVRQLGAAVKVTPVTTAEFPRPAVRPPYSVLSTRRYERDTGTRPASWIEGLREYLRAGVEKMNSEC
jgi:dTDP-4-dehydrorhamnose reductase